jgi:hypothetical protein
MANCEVILVLPDLLIVLMSRLALIACIGLFDHVLRLVRLSHSPAEALCLVEVLIVISL